MNEMEWRREVLQLLNASIALQSAQGETLADLAARVNAIEITRQNASKAQWELYHAATKRESERIAYVDAERAKALARDEAKDAAWEAEKTENVTQRMLGSLENRLMESLSRTAGCQFVILKEDSKKRQKKRVQKVTKRLSALPVRPVSRKKRK
jgi:hypothetical protein